jgi:hypothetical protein
MTDAGVGLSQHKDLLLYFGNTEDLWLFRIKIFFEFVVITLLYKVDGEHLLLLKVLLFKIRTTPWRKF